MKALNKCFIFSVVVFSILFISSYSHAVQSTDQFIVQEDFPPDGQNGPVVAMDANGNFIIVWTEQTNGGDQVDVFGQKYDYNGYADGSRFQISTGVQYQYFQTPSVDMNSDGNFIVVWQEYDDGGGVGEIYGQYFDSDSKVGDQFVVHEDVPGSYVDISYPPSVGMDDDGNFTVVWNSQIQYWDEEEQTLTVENDVYGQMYLATAGTPTKNGDEFMINAPSTYAVYGDPGDPGTNGIQQYPSIAMHSSGDDFIVVWEDQTSSVGGDSRISGQVFVVSVTTGLAEGNGEFQISTTTTDTLSTPRVAMAGNSNFITVWQNSTDGGLYGQEYNIYQEKQGDQFLITETAEFGQYSPSVAMSNEGYFVVSWFEVDESWTSAVIYAKMFDGTGTGTPTAISHVITVSQDITVSPSVSDISTGQAVGMSYNSEVVVGWLRQTESIVGGSGGEGDPYIYDSQYDIYARYSYDDGECSTLYDAEGSDRNWHTGTNWDEDVVPCEDCDVTITGTSNALPLLFSVAGTTGATRNLYLGEVGGATGNMLITDGELTSRNIEITKGDVTQTGGTVNVQGDGTGWPPNGILVVGRTDASTTVTYTMTGGAIVADILNVGDTDNGHGHFIQSGGTVTIDADTSITQYMMIGRGGGTGVYELTSTIYIANRPEGYLSSALMVAAGDSKGTLLIGDADTPGAILPTGAGTVGSNLRIGEHGELNEGVVRGWGSIELTGYIQNDGKVIADGYGTDRSLTMIRFSEVVNNPNDHTNNEYGWYAVNQGVLELPRLVVDTIGEHTYVWGQTDDDPVLDKESLVNSLSLTLNTTDKGFGIDISYYGYDHNDIPVEDGVIYDWFGVWNFEPTSSFSMTGGADLKIRFDHTSANALEYWNDPDMLLLHYNEALSVWEDVTDGLDWSNFTIWGTAPSFSWYGIGKQNDEPPPLVPEPTTLILWIMGGLLSAIFKRKFAR